MSDLKANPETCDHQLHNLILVDASCRNRGDEDKTYYWATLKCLACGKEIGFHTNHSCFSFNAYRDDMLINIPEDDK